MTRRTRRQFLAQMAAGSLGMLTAGWAHRFCVSASEPADFGVATGIAAELASGKPVSGARVSAAGYSALTDADGRYSLELPPGAHDLRVEAEGYLGMTMTRVTVSAGQAAPCDFELLPVNPNPDQLALVAARLNITAGSGNAVAGSSGSVQAVTIPSTIRVVTNYVQPYPPEGWVPVVVVMEMEEYLRGVVPYEMSPYAPLEALKAQAVAARSVAAAGNSAHSPYADVCTTTHCQYRGGTYYARTDQAVSETRGVAVTFDGYLAWTFYFGHCVGYTLSAIDNRWYAPWCVTVPCAPCAEKGYTSFWGHGVGMCQEGAEGYGGRGWSYDQILHHYYTGIQLTSSEPISVALTAPAPGALLRGVIAGTAVPSRTPERVDFYVDAQLVTSVTAAPWTMHLNTLTIPDGAHTLRAVAFAGGASGEDSVSFTVDNTPPAGSATAPAGWLASTRVPITLTWNADASAVQFSNNWRWQGEWLPRTTGAQAADAAALNGQAWFCRAGSDPAGASFGPYTCALPDRSAYQAYFRIRTSAAYPRVDLARFDIADKGGLRVYAQRTVTSEDLPLQGIYEEFMLPFTYASYDGTCAAPGASDGLEFRTYFLANRDLWLDCVTIYSAPRALESVITWNAARVEGEQVILVRLLDAAANRRDLTVKVRLDLTPPRMTQLGPNMAEARDTLSGLDPASARWSDSTDGGRTWSAWQPLPDGLFPAGTTSTIKLNAPEGAAADVRFMLSDMAGNTAWTRGQVTSMPLVY